MKRLYFTIALSLTLMVSLNVKGQTRDWTTMHKAAKDFRNNDFSAAEYNYLLALKSNPKNARAHYALGDVYLAKKNLDAAMKEYNAALKGEKNERARTCIFHNMGVINQLAALKAEESMNQRLLRKAIDCYKDALREFPDNEEARYNMVLCQKQLKNQQDKQQDVSNKSEEQQQTPMENQYDKMQAEQLLNRSLQAERQAKARINAQQPKRRSKEKNW